MTCYSHSRLSTFKQCTQKYKFQYIDKIRLPDEGIEGFMGKLVHEVLEKLYADLKDGKVHSLKFLTSYFNQAWKTKFHEKIKVVKKDRTAEDYRVIGEGCIENYYHTHFPFDAGKVIGLETTEFLSLGNGHSFHIRIDRLVERKDGVYEVHDYKTGGTVPTQEDLDKDRQLAMYSLWVREKFSDCKDVKLMWHYLVANKTLESKRTPMQLALLKTNIIEQIAVVEKNTTYEPKVSRLCDWCSYKHMCPAFEEKPLQETTVQLSEIGPIADKYGQLHAQKKKIEEEMDALRDQLVAHAKNEGITDVEGTQSKITIKGYESVRVPKSDTLNYATLISMLKEEGKWDDVIKLDSTALKKAMASWPSELRKKVEDYLEVTKSERVTVSKK